MKKQIFAAALLSLLLVFAGRAAAQDGLGSFEPGVCMFEGINLGLTTLTGEALGFECGYVVVPERHANPDGPTIRIPVAVRRSTSPDAQPDPLLLAQGGPGGDAFEIYSLLVPNSQIAATRDIVIFNQRGTPYAEPDLNCPETDAVLPDMLAATEDESDRIFIQALDECYARLLAEGVDLSAYNSLENAADIPVIARALGYEEYNFYGVSYGTLLGLHLMRNHPENLRSVILDSVVSTDINFISEIPASENRVFDEVFADCEADQACRENYPGLEDRYYALVRQFDDAPLTVTLTNPQTGERHEALISGSVLRSILFQLLYVSRMYAVLPKIVSDLEKGDTRYIEGMWPLLVFDQPLAKGMYYSVICAEDADIDVTQIPIDSLRPEIGDTARDDIQSFIDTCARWRVEQLPPSIDDPVESDIPTLLLSGRFDPITPPAFAAAAAAGLSNATALVDQTASHGVAFLSTCVDVIVSDFLNDPASSPDSSCLDQQVSAIYVPPDAITVPLLGQINSLDGRTIGVLGIAGLLLLVILSPFLIWPMVYIVRAFGDGQPTREPRDRRLRIFSRVVMLGFGALALAFTIGLLTFIISVLATDLTMATAMALPASAAPILWLPVVLLVLAVGIVIAAIMLWRQGGAGSTLGKVYYSLMAVAAVAFLVVIGSQQMLWPPF